MYLNKAFLFGNLTKDPEVRYMTTGEAVANCSIACNEKWKNKAGEKQESVEYINLVFYRRLAEVVGEYLKKGSMIYVEGKLQTRKWQDKEGKDRYTTDIIVNEMTMLGGKPQGGEQHDDAQPERQPETRSAPAAARRPPQDQIGAFADFSDDIPFQNPYAGKWWSVQ